MSYPNWHLKRYSNDNIRIYMPSNDLKLYDQSWAVAKHELNFDVFLIRFFSFSF